MIGVGDTGKIMDKRFGRGKNCGAEDSSVNGFRDKPPVDEYTTYSIITCDLVNYDLELISRVKWCKG